MNKSKKLLCFVLAIVVMISSLGIVSAIADTEPGGGEGNTTVATQPTTALTGDPEYFLKFNADMLASPTWLSNNEMVELFGEEVGKSGEYVKSAAKSGSKVTLHTNNSITLAKDSVTDGSDYQYAANLEIPVTQEMRENYLKADNKLLYISYYFSKANLTAGLYKGQFTDCQFRIYTKFATAYEDDVEGVKFNRKIKLASIGKNAYYAYQQKINTTLKLLGSDDKPLENLDGVESIIFSIYNYNKNVEAALELSGITYAGVPEITPFEAPQPAPVGEYVSMTDWTKNYLNSDFGDTPGTVKYNKDGGYNANDYATIDAATRLGASGWVYFKQMSAVTTKQVNVNFKLDRDAFNKAIVSAKQPGASGKISLKCKFPVIKDTEGKEMMGEFQVAFFPHNGSMYVPVQEWIKANKEYVFEIDASQLDVNSIANVKIALMAFWKYDAEDDVYYDVDVAKKYDKDGNLLTAVRDGGGTFLGYDNGQGGAYLQEADVAKITANCSNGQKDVDITDKISRFTVRTMQDIEAFISPMYAGEMGSQSATTTTVPTTSATETSGDGDYEYAGEHFYDFTSQAYAETYGWGSHASFVNYLHEDYYDSFEVVDKDYEKDDMKQGYKDRKNPSKKVDGDDKYIKDYNEAKNLDSKGYQVELSSPYPRVQTQHQAFFHLSGADEDARLTNPDAGDHKNQKPQGEKYDFREQMASALKHAKEHPDENKRGYLAIDVYPVYAVHGYKNVYNSTYKAWCKKNNKKVTNEISPIQVLVSIHASFEGEDMSATVMTMIPSGQKKTIYLDVSELEIDYITGVRVAAQNYSHLANKEQGGNNLTCGITDVQCRFSAIYVPGKNSDLKKTVDVTETVNEKDMLKIKKLYDALPGLTVDDYNTLEDYNKLAAFKKAWSNASIATQDKCAEEYGIDIALIGMLEMDVYDKLFIYGGLESPDTGDIAFPMISLLVAGLACYVILRARRKRA